ncbi:murein hydrolase activator EnvC family protein [Alkalihalobacterium elongatum]|uniref:murein hydrolase activator EnvC family protein n=1 Tax=Alkalihalobacterium elongatum TaxID=2675466 RepID=UPI001C1F5CA2|nr:peptidoglycan DD-metalloendopeptidase family protein [Alkalihalobacterium elongatum]
MRRRSTLVLMSFVLAASTVFAGFGPNFTLANTEIKNKLSDIKEEKQEKQQEAEKQEAELKKIEAEQKKLEDEIRKIDMEVSETDKKINQKQAEIEDVREEIELLKEELVIIENRIEERDELLKDRARSMYQNGGSVSYLEVILGAKSFGDFLDRLSALTMIAQQDRNILEAHLEDHRLLEEKKEKVEENLVKLENHLIELERLMAQLESQKKEKDRIMEKLLAKGEEISVYIVSLEDEAAILADQERAVQAELAAWEEEQRQIALQKQREEQERQRELERQRQQQQAEQQQTQQQPSRSNSSPTVESAPSTGSGTLMRPASGRFSSPYGWRTHPITGSRTKHHGLDIANSTGTPIYAAEAGTVIAARYMNGYGNTVMISHNVNGEVLTTLYAHMNSISVSNGQRVSRGQEIGKMGSTGASTGPHLHFEVHRGSWNGAKSNSVNPMNYIN